MKNVENDGQRKKVGKGKKANVGNECQRMKEVKQRKCREWCQKRKGGKQKREKMVDNDGQRIKEIK